MKILLTGGSGMLGRNILEHSSFSKFEIYYPSSKDLNLSDYANIVRYLNENKIDTIIHCAGRVGGIHANIADPVGFLNDNLIMGLNLVNAAYACRVNTLVNLGSSCMYPKDYSNPLKEEYMLAAPLESTNEGYAIAKIAVAKLCEYMSRQYGVHYKTLIPCNLYGRWDKFSSHNSHMVPAVISKIHLAKENNLATVEIWGNGESRREFMLASDCADAIFFALQNFEKFDNYTNIGLGYDYKINEYYSIVAKIVGYSGGFIHDLSKPTGMFQKLTGISKLKALGWSSNRTLEDGIVEAYRFYLESLIGKVR